MIILMNLVCLDLGINLFSEYLLIFSSEHINIRFGFIYLGGKVPESPI